MRFTRTNHLIMATVNRFLQLCSRRCFHAASWRLGAYDAEFKAAKEKLGTMTEDPGNQAKLKIYALFKQSTVGNCNVPKPGMMDLVGKAKWEAWNSLGTMTQDEAQKAYIDYVNELAGPTAVGGDDTNDFVSSSQDILVEIRDKIQMIKLNRPEKKNAITMEMYSHWAEILEKSAQDKSFTLTVITGSGDYYSSGNDLSNIMKVDPSNLVAKAIEGGEILERFVKAFIDHPKPIVALVNGPAVGVSVTTLGLCDVVYASDKATFNTPFTALGQSPEGCSSYTFPRMMGAAKASEVLLFNKKLSAQEACDRNLVTEVFPDLSFQNEVLSRLAKMAALPPNSLRLSKGVIRQAESNMLHEVNRREVELLVERWQSHECISAIMKFFSKK